MNQSSLTDCPRCGHLCVGASLLPCGHLLCRKCLRLLLDTELYKSIDCPTCHSTVRPASRPGRPQVGDFPSDVVMDRLVMEMLIERSGRRCCVPHHDSPAPCPPTNVCLDCGDLFCDRCSHVHQNSSATTAHNLKPLKPLDSPATGPLSPSRPHQDDSSNISDNQKNILQEAVRAEARIFLQVMSSCDQVIDGMKRHLARRENDRHMLKAYSDHLLSAHDVRRDGPSVSLQRFRHVRRECQSRAEADMKSLGQKQSRKILEEKSTQTVIERRWIWWEGHYPELTWIPLKVALCVALPVLFSLLLGVLLLPLMTSYPDGVGLQDTSLNEHTSSGHVTSEHTSAQFTSEHTSPGQIMSEHTSSGQVMSEHTSSGQVMSEHTSSGQVMSEHTSSGQVTTSEHTSSGQVTSEHTSSGQLMSEHTSPSQIMSERTSSGQVMSEHTSSGQVMSEHTSSGQVMSEYTSSGQVMSEQLSSGQGMPEHTSSGLLTTSEHTSSGQVTSEHTSSGQVATSEHTLSGQAMSKQTSSGQLTSEHTSSAQVTSEQTSSEQDTSKHASSPQIRSEPTSSADITTEDILPSTPIRSGSEEDCRPSATTVVPYTADRVVLQTLDPSSSFLTGSLCGHHACSSHYDDGVFDALVTADNRVVLTMWKQKSIVVKSSSSGDQTVPLDCKPTGVTQLPSGLVAVTCPHTPAVFLVNLDAAGGPQIQRIRTNKWYSRVASHHMANTLIVGTKDSIDIITLQGEVMRTLVDSRHLPLYFLTPLTVVGGEYLLVIAGGSQQIHRISLSDSSHPLVEALPWTFPSAPLDTAVDKAGNVFAVLQDGSVVMRSTEGHVRPLLTGRGGGKTHEGACMAVQDSRLLVVTVTGTRVGFQSEVMEYQLVDQ